MKLFLVLCIVITALFSACKNPSAVSASISLEIPADSELQQQAVSAETTVSIPVSAAEQIERSEQFSSDCEEIQRFIDPNSGMEAKLLSDGTVSIVDQEEAWIVEKPEIPFSHLAWSNDGCLRFMDGESIVLLYSPSQRAFLCTGVPLAENG